MVDRNSATPLYRQIQDNIYAQIRAGELRPGSRVPSEIDLVEQYNVSRMTARRALDELVSKGFLFRRQGKGTFVTANVVTYGLSTMLSFSGTLRAKGYSVTTRVLHQGTVPAPPAVAEKLKLPPESNVVLIRRLRIVNERAAAIHTSFLDHAIFAPLLRVDLSTKSLLSSIEEISGLRVAYTKDSVQAALVAAEDRNLLGVASGTPVLQVEGVAYTVNGQPIRHTRAVYPSDMFRMVMTNSGDQNSVLHFNGEL